jgi:hypothetical protein
VPLPSSRRPGGLIAGICLAVDHPAAMTDHLPIARPLGVEPDTVLTALRVPEANEAAAVK